MIQAALGIPDQHIAADYALSNRLLDPNPEFERLFAELNVPRQEIARALTMRPELMLELLAGIRQKHGSIDELLESCRIPAVVLEQLRAVLIES